LPLWWRPHKGKKINGRKRHIAVDTIGLLLTVLLTVLIIAAGVQDRDGARPLLWNLRKAFPWVRLTWVGGGYAGKLVTWAKAKLKPKLILEIGKLHVRFGKGARTSGPRPRWVPMLDGLDLVPDAHPHEALLGLLALLHGASSDEVRHLRADDVDTSRQAIRLGTRPHPVPLDPSSWQTLQRCLAHRDSQRTSNPHVIVTKGTKAGRSPASAAYFSHLLDECGVPPRTMRCTRLGELVNTIDPKLVAAAFGMDPEGVMFYLSDHVGDSYLQTFPGPEGEMIPGHG
jgi:integrase